MENLQKAQLRLFHYINYFNFETTYRIDYSGTIYWVGIKLYDADNNLLIESKIGDFPSDSTKKTNQLINLCDRLHTFKKD